MDRSAQHLKELAFLFFRLGSTAFGGPAAAIAMMEDDVVGRRGWLSREKFLDLLGATNLIPGPNSTEMAIHIGYLRGGWPGLLIAGSCFILPAAILVTVIAAAYSRFGTLPQAVGLLYGVKPVVIAIIAQALWRLGRTAVKTRALAVVGLTAAALNLAGLSELIVLFGAGALVAVSRRVILATQRGSAPLIAMLLASATTAPLAYAGLSAASAATTVPFSLWKLLVAFLKIGSVLYGSGYVLLAFLRADFVEHWGWLSEGQLIDATAVGQVTPGPLFTTATFIGYFLAGPTGALIATIGIFLPAFFFVAISGPLVARLRQSPTAGALLDGVNVGALALMAVVTLQLGRAAFVDVTTWALGVTSLILLLRFRLGSGWLVLGGAVVGLLAPGPS